MGQKREMDVRILGAAVLFGLAATPALTSACLADDFKSLPEGPGGAGILHDAAHHLARAAELASAGHYVEALGHRFLAVVLELDHR